MKKIYSMLFALSFLGASMLPNDFIGQNLARDKGGWFLPVNTTWHYDSADAPSYIVDVEGDMSEVLYAGLKVRIEQTTGGTKYFIITRVDPFDGDVTPIVLYGGTDYTLANEAINNPLISREKAPMGFPLLPSKWTVIVTDSTLRSQAAPVSATWYNLDASHKIDIPPGAWVLSYTSEFNASFSPSGNINLLVTLSIDNDSTGLDADYKAFRTIWEVDGTLSLASITAQRNFPYETDEEITYYLIHAVNNNATFLRTSYIVISAVCAYL